MRVRGQDTTGGPGTIVQRAMMTTSDLASVMGDALGKSMRQAFQAVPSALRPLVRQISVPDFRKQHRIQVSAVPPLEKVNQAGEFPHVAISDMEETLQLATYGNIVTLSRQIIANDELAAVADMARRQGIAAAATEAAMLAAAVEDNPAMSDSHNVFDATYHHNLAESGGSNQRYHLVGWPACDAFTNRAIRPTRCSGAALPARPGGSRNPRAENINQHSGNADLERQRV